MQWQNAKLLTQDEFYDVFGAYDVGRNFEGFLMLTLLTLEIKATRKCYKRGFLILPDSNDEKYFVRMQKDWGCNFVPLKKIQILKTFLSMEGRLHPEVAFISTIQAGKADDFWNKHGNLCGKQRALQSPARKKTLQF